MNYFADFDRHVIGERNEGIRHEVRTPRLEKRLAAFVSKSTRPLLRRAGLAG